MKKKVLIGVSSVFVIILCICICFYMGKDNSDDEMYTSNIEDEKENSIGGFLTLMLETEAGSGVYEKSISSTWPGEGYVFNENLSSCENGGELSWNEELGAVNLKTNNTEKCYVYFDKEPDIVYLADYIINNVYVEDGVNALYYHDGQGTYTNVDQEADDNSYRYSGANPDNYVCFGSDEVTCPNDNLYRIIGVFNDTGDYQVKLIKYDYANSNLLGTNGDYSGYIHDDLWGISPFYKGTINQSLYMYYWDGGPTGTGTWSESNLNIINLNTNYLNNIGTNWSKLVANHTWQVAGMLSDNALYNTSVKIIYTYEVGANKLKDGDVYSCFDGETYDNTCVVENSEYTTKIGLMYVSDYGYAASPENWTAILGYENYNADISQNWMHMGLNEFTTSFIPDSSTFVYMISSNGKIYFNASSDGIHSWPGAVRPVFYLNSDVQYASGSGTQSDPIRLVV